MPIGVYIRTEEHRKNLSIAHKGQIAWCKGKKLSLEHRKKLSISHRKNPVYYWLGKKRSPETIQKMREGMIGKMCGPKHPNYNGGRYKDKSGYILILKHNHPFPSHPDGYVLEHRLVAEKYLGRYLKPTEQVHHINEISDDNKPENLFVFENFATHRLFHVYLKSNPILKTFLESNLS